MKAHKTFPLAASVLALALAGCSLTTPVKTPGDLSTPAWRDEVATTDAAIDPEWWRAFGRDELTGLIAAALAENTDMQQALARIEQARARLRIAGASLYPAVGAGGSIGRDWSEPFGDDSSGRSSARGSLSVSYEIDLWGANVASRDSARLRALGSEYDRAALALVIASDVAQIYAEVLSLNDRLEITRNRLANVREILDLVEIRFREGAVSGLELAQQRGELASLEATIANLERQRTAAVNELAVLTGRAPQEFPAPAGSLNDLALPAPVIHPPALLLTRRPDLASAEAALRAAHADIAVARAAFFPSLTIGGDLSVAANPISAAATTAAGIVGSLSAPIFEGGRLSGNLALSKAARDELVARYRGAVLQSFREAEDAMAGLRSAEARNLAYEEATKQAQIAYDISRERFEVGSIDFLTLLDAQRSLLQAQENLIVARQDRLAAIIQLYKAMGGGWTADAAADMAAAGL